jgi:hypothetical protein
MPWQTMQVDIATYEEDANGAIQKIGSYVLPLIWNGCFLVFLLEFSKKTVPVHGSNAVSKTGDIPVNAVVPATYWSIKMTRVS